jgi:hypothetical protein
MSFPALILQFLRKQHVWLLLVLLLPFTSSHAQWRLDVEAGAFTVSRNEVQIPNDNEGDRFKITDLGDDAFASGRLSLAWRPVPKHEIQFVYVPLSYSEKGSFDEDIRFDGVTFAANDKLEARYKFDSYRLRYLYHLVDNEKWNLELGGTLFVRDASIKLSQNGINSKDSNVGLVPLFALKAAYSLSRDWSLVIDSDLAVAPQGRAIDFSLMAQRQLGKNWQLAGGYRTIEGGADNDDVYNFAWFNGAVVRVGYTW